MYNGWLRTSVAQLNLDTDSSFTEGFSMFSAFERGKEAAGNERAVSLLSDRTGAPLAEVRTLFAQEFSRLELRAKVRSYLAVLASSNVLARLRRGGIRAVEPGAPDAINARAGAAVPRPPAHAVI